MGHWGIGAVGPFVSGPMFDLDLLRVILRRRDIVSQFVICTIGGFEDPISNLRAPRVDAPLDGD